MADNVLLPDTFTMGNVQLNRLVIKKTTKADTLLLCAITSKNQLLLHSLHIQVSDQKLRVHTQKKTHGVRKITKLDYMEYMIEKFGSRAAIYYPEDDKLCLHTTYIMKEQAQNAMKLCEQISEKICKSLEDKEKKNFKYLTWHCNVLPAVDEIEAKEVLLAIKNKPRSGKNDGDKWIKNLITQIPIQIARGTANTFKLLFNGEE
eukprot:831378_1